MAFSRVKTLRHMIGVSNSRSRSAGVALGVQLRNSATTTDDDSDDSDEPEENKTCRKCKTVNGVEARYCKNCGHKMDDERDEDGLARSGAKRSVALITVAEAVDRLNAKLDAHEHSHVHGVDMSVFSKSELKVLGYGGPPPARVKHVSGEPVFGLLSPAQAKAELARQERAISNATRKGARR